MAGIQDWFDFVTNLPNIAPLISVCIDTVDIPINLAIPIPQFIVLPELELPDLSQLLDGLPEPPQIPNVGIRQKIELKVPVPSLSGGGSGPPELTPESILSTLVGGLSSILNAGKGDAIPSLKLPQVTLPTFPDDVLSLFNFSLEQCADEPNEKIAQAIPGQDTKPPEPLTFNDLLDKALQSGEQFKEQLKNKLELLQTFSQLQTEINDVLAARVDLLDKNTELTTLGFPTYLEASKQAQKLVSTLTEQQKQIQEEEHDHNH